MNLTSIPDKYKYSAVIILVLVSFASGRYSVQKPTTKDTSIVTNTVKTKERDNTHTKTKIIEDKKPNGEVVTTEIIEQTNNDTKDQTEDTMSKQVNTSTPPKINTLNVSALVAENFSNGLNTPSYGIAITKQILGPITVGGFGLTNGVIGVSIGINF